MATHSGIGARLIRKEDARHLHGRARFVADIALPGMQDVAFLRSPMAHGLIRDVAIPADIRERVFTWADMTDVQPIRGANNLPGFRSADYPPLADGKVRFVGEPIALCLAASRAEAEDLAARVEVDLEALPAVPNMDRATEAGTPLLHQHWPDNLVLETRVEGTLTAGAEAALEAADITVEREVRLNRQCMAPLEGKAVIAQWDPNREELLLHSSTQGPHLVRHGLSLCLGLPERQIRVVAPDVGGGFGYKLVLQPEEVALAWLAMRCPHPVRWVEDRYEHLIIGANAREHRYKVRAQADATGKILGLEVDVEIDTGAYSIFPFTSAFEAAQAGASFPGPYTVPVYRCRTRSYATNKPPIQPYRGVSRTGICFALELVIDAIAREVGREPHEVRIDNLVPPDAMPYSNVAGKLFDSGDYPEAVRRAREMIDFESVRRRQSEPESDGRLIGIGFASYTEQTAHGTAVFAGAGLSMVPGHERARVRLAPDGELEIQVGMQSHGQGLETTLAQVASEVLGIDPAKVTVRHGDSAETPFSIGTYASRSMVMAGGAVARACETLAERIARIAAQLLQCAADEVEVRDGAAHGPGGQASFAEVAQALYRRPEQLTPEVEAESLEAVGSFKPTYDHGAFTYATHAAVVAVDPELGAVEILDYVIVEDCGQAVNPLIVEGQTIGGTAQGIGTALYEETPYDADGQPLAATLADYLLPGATEVPDLRIDHMVSPSPYTAFGIKGVGESGAIAPPAALANAINDALRGLGVELSETPMTPRRVFEAIQAASVRAI